MMMMMSDDMIIIRSRTATAQISARPTLPDVMDTLTDIQTDRQRRQQPDDL